MNDSLLSQLLMMQTSIVRDIKGNFFDTSCFNPVLTIKMYMVIGLDNYYKELSVIGARITD